MFLLVVEATNKKKFIIMDAMDHINTNPFEIHKNKTKFHEMTFKHFKYLKERNKKVHKMNNNMVKV